MKEDKVSQARKRAELGLVWLWLALWLAMPGHRGEQVTHARAEQL